MSIDLGGATLVLTNLPAELASRAGEKSADFAVVALMPDGSFVAPKTDNYRNGKIESSDITLDSGELAAVSADFETVKKLTLMWSPASLTWAGGNNGAWVIKGDVNGWTNDDTQKPDVFYQGDIVTFAANSAAETVTLSGDLNPAAMNVTGGEYTFSGDGTLTVAGDLNMTGGSILFAREISANRSE